MDENQQLANSFIFYVVTLVFLAVGAITSLGLPWYAHVSVPAGTPSEWMIALIWGVIFFLAALSAIRFWDAPRTAGFRATLALYAATAAIVLLWNYLFFGLHLLGYALLVSLVVAVLLLVLIARLWKLTSRSAYLLLPYLLWVFYAAWLGYGFMTLNP